MTDAWAQAADLARTVYREAYGAEIDPRPDMFLIARDAADGDGPVVACAGLSFGRERPLFSEVYLEHDIETELADRLAEKAVRRQVVEVGSLATRTPQAGREIIRATPIVAWCLGMEYILCTATSRLTTTLTRTGITFVPFGPAEPERVPADQRASWGSYYDHGPQVGVIPLNALDRLFAEATGRYSFIDMQFMLTGGGVAHAAG
jgi:hypothetical protein